MPSDQGVPYVERLRVPDEDAQNWIHTLMEGGFSSEEIDMIMVHLNDTYAREKLGAYVDDEIRIINDMIERRRGTRMTELEKTKAEEVVLERLRKLSLEDLRRGIRKP